MIPTPPNPTARNPESGYALLFVFAMAAIVSIGLYEQLPRAAFEAQREKEGLLVDHGEQYKRAVQLYCRKMGRYPAKLEDLDNTQNIRFLRRHYIDPMTGKEEWRLLHMGPAGKLIDSKIEVVDPNKDQWHAGSITEFKSSGSADGGPENANIATRRRPSDDQVQTTTQGGMMPGANPDPAPIASDLQPGSVPGGPPVNPDPNAPPQPPNGPSWLKGGALPGMPAGQRNLTMPQNVTAQNGALSLANAAAQASVGGNGGFGASVSGNGGFGPPVSSQTGGVSPQPINPPGNYPPGAPPPAYPITPGSNQPGSFGQQGLQTTPANIINDLLTRPRPGGLNGSLNGIGGSVVGGFAGVASTFKGRGVRHYNDQDEYLKWEFYYDLGKEMSATAMQGVVPVNQGQQNRGIGVSVQKPQ